MNKQMPARAAAELVARPHSRIEEDFVYRGMCDASVAAAFDEHRFAGRCALARLAAEFI